MVPQPPLPKPQQDYVGCLLRYGVEFLVIGGRAVQAHGVVDRSTHDLDLLLVQHPANASRLSEALSRYSPRPPGFEGWEEAAMSRNKRFAYPDGYSPGVDLLTSIDGIDSVACFGRAVKVPYGRYLLPVAARSDLIHMKQVSMASGNDPRAHERDRLDIEALRSLP